MRAPPQIRLLGEGLDAIIIPTARPRTWLEKVLRLRALSDWRYLRTVSNADRLPRYHDAALFRPMYRDPQLLDLRERRGWNYLKAWRAGTFPKVGRLRRLVPVLSLTKLHRAASARG